MSKQKQSGEGLEGEGSYTAARKYDAKAREFQKTHDVPALAREARRALQGPEGQDLARAEQRGKAGPARKASARPAPARSTAKARPARAGRHV
jgi:hypothetical protein